MIKPKLERSRPDPASLKRIDSKPISGAAEAPHSPKKARRPLLSVRKLPLGILRRLEEIKMRTQDDEETILSLAIEEYHHKIFK